MKKIIAHTKELYREFGFWITLKRAIFKAVRHIFETNSAFWLERDMQEPIPEVKPRIPVEVNIFGKEETIAWFKEQQEGSWIFDPREIEVGLRERHIFPNIKYHGQIVGYLKAGIGKIYIGDYKQTIALPKKVAFCYDYYVSPAFRGKNLSMFMNVEVMKFANELGIKKVRCHIPPGNTTSIKVARKLGFKLYKYVRCFRILSLFNFYHEKPVSDEKLN